MTKRKKGTHFTNGLRLFCKSLQINTIVFQHVIFNRMSLVFQVTMEEINMFIAKKINQILSNNNIRGKYAN